MRNITVSLPDETYINVRVWAAQRDTSLSTVVEYLLRTLPNIQHAVSKSPVTAIDNSGSKPVSSAPATTSISITSSPKIA
jgi:hypothetical protein